MNSRRLALHHLHSATIACSTLLELWVSSMSSNYSLASRCDVQFEKFSASRLTIQRRSSVSMLQCGSFSTSAPPGWTGLEGRSGDLDLGYRYRVNIMSFQRPRGFQAATSRSMCGRSPFDNCKDDSDFTYRSTSRLSLLAGRFNGGVMCDCSLSARYHR